MGGNGGKIGGKVVMIESILGIIIENFESKWWDDNTDERDDNRDESEGKLSRYLHATAVQTLRSLPEMVTG